MASQLYYQLLNRFDPKRNRAPLNGRPPTPIQVDDQSDTDNISEFCTVFVTMQKNDELLVEVEGKMPLNGEVSALKNKLFIESRPQDGRIAVRITPEKISSLHVLSDVIRSSTTNHSLRYWPGVAERTANSLDNLVKVVEEFRQ